MTGPTQRYRSPDEDSARWLRFEARPDDIVISTRSKHGTTWMQMICALLVLRTPRLPAALPELSPWLDFLPTPESEVFGMLAAQRHRRFIKTHTPLDGLPRYPGVRYIVVARHPLDAAVSLYHHGGNLDRARMRRLTGQGDPGRPTAPRPALADWLRAWTAREPAPRAELDSLPGVALHYADAWRRRAEDGVLLVHYDELRRDLSGQMRRIAGHLGLAVPAATWPELIEAAGFTAMRARAGQVAPNQSGVLLDPAAFFRRGGSGEGRGLLTLAEVAEYRRRIGRLLPPEATGWLHQDSGSDSRGGQAGSGS